MCCRFYLITINTNSKKKKKTQHSIKIKCLRSDHGGEYTSGDFTKFLQEQGMERRLTTHDTPQHNGMVESLNRRLLKHVCTMLHYAQLPKNLWGEAIMFAVWLKNCTSTRALGNVTPFEQLYSSKPDLAGVLEWGQRVWVHNDKGSKLDAQALEARWVGFDKDSTHAHRIYWPDKHHISVEQNIKFVPTMVTVYSPSPRAPTPMPVPQPLAIPQPAPISSSTTASIKPSTTSTPMSQVNLPAAIDSGEEEVPELKLDNEGIENIMQTLPPVMHPTIGSQLKQKTPVQPPGAPKKSKVMTTEPTR
jgi:hypothetical protein